MDSETLNIVLGIFIVAQTIARITPTKKDDKIVGGIGRILNLLFLQSRNK
ncbi:MAG: hypothetical protein U9Q21_02425 [Candidatus Auribacterota bacterium]|nr:hypothetical protein [Candidatus Auribacterota bacterium]